VTNLKLININNQIQDDKKLILQGLLNKKQKVLKAKKLTTFNKKNLYNWMNLSKKERYNLSKQENYTYLYKRKLLLDEIRKEYKRISRSIERLKNLKMLLNEIKTPTPFAFPLLVERLKNTLSNEPIEKRVEKLIKKYSI